MPKMAKMLIVTLAMLAVPLSVAPASAQFVYGRQYGPRAPNPQPFPMRPPQMMPRPSFPGWQVQPQPQRLWPQNPGAMAGQTPPYLARPYWRR